MNFTLFKQTVEKDIQIAADAFKDQTWQDQRFYKNYLAQTYYYVCHSTRLLALAASRFDVRDDALHLRFLEHAAEEKRHELVAKKDLEKMGYDVSQYLELATTQALYQTQYYWIEHKNPLCFFGYVLALEGIAVFGAGESYQKLKAGGLEKSAHFLKIHSDEDPDHFDKAIEAIQKSVRHDEEFDLIYKNFRLSLDLYFSMLLSCHNTHALRSAA